MCAAGIQGNENDPGAYQLTPIYNDPSAYLLPHHTGLFDGVFQGKLHKDTDRAGMLPANANELNRANPTMRVLLKAMNRTQRYLRCPIEQTFGYIKGFSIVGESYFRGGIDQQGENMLLCTQLSARLMRIRDAFPRGDKWMCGEEEEWEKTWHSEGWLYMDPLHPGLY
jgi:hypothetical protein|tara:strand:- start:91 stop:594 length:504 start_codon:yes stop_codon:yes gene_type:complete